jgi:hypothetical protein
MVMPQMNATAEAAARSAKVTSKGVTPVKAAPLR